MLLNSEGNKIGYLILNGDLKQIEEIYNYNQENINIRINKNKGEMNQQKIDKFYSFLFCLFNIKNMYNNQLKINNEKDIQIIKLLDDFIQSRKIDDKIKEYFIKSIESNDYKFIINDIFEKNDSELYNDKKDDYINKQNNQVDQYDEIKTKNKFLEKSKNASIFKQLFSITMEEILLCDECHMSMYNFYYSNFFLVDLDKEEKEISLNEHLFKPEDISTKQKCNFCAGKATSCTKKEKIIDYPEILIIILDGKNFNKFKLEDNMHILCNNGQDILYDLISFIESDTNYVYINENIRWYKYFENNNKSESIDYNKKNPIVLFYKITDRKYINKLINDNKNDIYLENKDNNDLNNNNNDSKITKNNINLRINNRSINFNKNLNSNENVIKNNFNIMENHNNLNNSTSSYNNNMNENKINNMININNNSMVNNNMSNNNKKEFE
jgi:hypothetical protein